MPIKSSITFLSIFLIIIVAPFAGISKSFQENQLTKAIQLFDRGNYADAEPIFKNLIDNKPDDFMINYFYGACRTENGHYSKKDLACLLKASKEVSPHDIDYYFGVQYQAQENWEQALKHYNKYSKTASEGDLRRVNLTEKIQQCYDRINPYQTEDEYTENTIDDLSLKDLTSTESENDSVNISDSLNVTNTEIIPVNSTEILSTSAKDSLPAKSDSAKYVESNEILNSDSLLITEKQPEEIKPVSAERPIEFSVNSEIAYRFLSQFKTSEGKALFVEGKEKQNRLDSTLKTLDFLRNKYVSVYSRKEKDSIGQQILALETHSYELKSETNQLLMKSKAVENEYWQNASEQEISKFMEESRKISTKTVRKNVNNSLEPKDSDKVAIPEILIEDIPTDNTAPPSPSTSDLIYKVQIGAYSRGIPAYRKKVFDKLAFIRRIDNYTDENGVVVYTTGNLTRYEDAQVMQKQIRQEGVDDAFIVPYLNGKRITLEQAKEIEGIK